MKILFLSNRIPYPPDKGDRIPVFYRMKHLSQKHEVSIVFPCYYRSEFKYLDKVKEFCKDTIGVYINPRLGKARCLLASFLNKSMTLEYSYSKNLKEGINNLIRGNNFDLIYVYSSGMAQYVEDINNIPKVIDLADSDSHKWLQYSKAMRFPMSRIYHKEGLWLKNYERLLCDKFDQAIAISENEKKLFSSYIPNKEFNVVSNGVDLEYFSPNGENYDSNKLVFVGVIDYYANVDCVTYFVKEILPLIKKKIPKVKFYIVGSNPTKKVKRLAKDKNIIVTGRVSDVRPYINQAGVSVVPLRIGQGVQNKILEAMASAVPVVTTTRGNQGIRALSGENIFVEDSPHKFAERVIELISNRQLRKKIGLEARKFVENNFKWQKNLEIFEDVLKNAYAKNQN